MEDNISQTEASTVTEEPVKSDNSASENMEVDVKSQQEVNEVPANEGKSLKEDPSNELILGKFKSVEDLTKAYEELQKHQGVCSDELGQLRKIASKVEEANKFMSELRGQFQECVNYLQQVKNKYNAPEYFQNPNFVKMYNEAFSALGKNLDTDKFIGLLDEYVSSRISAYDKKNASDKETQKVLDSMNYNKNSYTAFTPPKKRLDEMTQKEVDEMLDRLI